MPLKLFNYFGVEGDQSIQCCFNVGPASQSVGKHRNSIRRMPCVCWVCFIYIFEARNSFREEKKTEKHFHLQMDEKEMNETSTAAGQGTTKSRRMGIGRIFHVITHSTNSYVIRPLGWYI